MADLVGSLTQGRARFMRAVARLPLRRWHAIVVEGDWHMLTMGMYRSRARPTALVGSIAAIVADGTPVLFASTPQDAATLTLRLLAKFHSRAVADEARREAHEATAEADDEGTAGEAA